MSAPRGRGGPLVARFTRERSRVQGKEFQLLLIIAVILLVIAIAGGAIVHPVLFALGIVALVLFFQGR
jgi:hypothetical protein